jgi:hypothetical protein
MLTTSTAHSRLHRPGTDLAPSLWAVGLTLAVACGSPLRSGNPLIDGAAGNGSVVGAGGSVGADGASALDASTGNGGRTGSGGVGGSGAGGAGGVAGKGGTVGSGGSGSGGRLIGSGGASPSGGVSGTGGVLVGGGSVGGGGRSGAGGVGGEAGNSTYGKPCGTNLDCTSDAICCDGSDPTCDGTRVPPGDGGNAGEFIISADGLTVTDTITGLVWQIDDMGPRAGCTCPPGGDPTACTAGESIVCSWKEAQAYCASLLLGGVSGWRLPAAVESLTIRSLVSSTDPSAFPGELGRRDWIAASHGEYGLYFDSYYDKLIYCPDATIHLYVRCVRGSRCYPKTRFAALDGGLVREMLTGLVWQEKGSPTVMDWVDAQSYCASLGPAFRLPTFRELVSLLGLSSGPTTPFPGGVDGAFWTSTPGRVPPGESTSYALYVDYSSGQETCETAYYSGAAVSSSHNVRCVR